MELITFHKGAFDDFNEWSATDKIIHKKIIDIIKDIRRNPYKGIGKPEPLRHELSGYWSRRINNEHRLVYKVIPGSIVIISCKYHYSK